MEDKSDTKKVELEANASEVETREATAEMKVWRDSELSDARELTEPSSPRVNRQVRSRGPRA